MLNIIHVARSTLIDNMSDLMIVFDEKNRLAYINPSAREILGEKNCNLTGKPFHEIFQKWPDILSLEKTDSIKKEIILPAEDRQKYYDLLISPLKTEETSFIGRLIIMRDITEKKVIEEELVKAKEENELLRKEKIFKTGEKKSELYSSKEKKSVKNHRKKPCNILLVEDNIVNQKLIASILKKKGYSQVDTVNNGYEAIECLKKIDYDLVLMDCQMPGIDGYETTKLIRSKTSPVLNRNIPVIAMTAGAIKGDREKCLDAGMNDYMTKPVKIDILIETIEKWIISKDEYEIFNHKSLLENLIEDENLAKNVIKTFIEDIEKTVTGLREAIKKNDMTSVKSLAHLLKGSSSLVYAQALSHTAGEVEKEAIRGAINDKEFFIKEIDGNLEKFKKAAEKWLSEIVTPDRVD
jgi:PAS domain S-box-containing protein